MSIPDQGLTIGGLAKAAGVNVETIRFYQRTGLMPEPDRPTGGIRRYGEEDLSRLSFIKASQRLGFSLDEIADLLKLEDGSSCGQARLKAEAPRDSHPRIANAGLFRSACVHATPCKMHPCQSTNGFP